MRAAITGSTCIIGVVVIDATHTSSSLVPTMSRRQERRRDEGHALPVASLRGSERLTRHTETNSLGKIKIDFF
jgi:NAD dependent epimerase/dehydratase family enzyme